MVSIGTLPGTDEDQGASSEGTWTENVQQTLFRRNLSRYIDCWLRQVDDLFEEWGLARLLKWWPMICGKWSFIFLFQVSSWLYRCGDCWSHFSSCVQKIVRDCPTVHLSGLQDLLLGLHMATLHYEPTWWLRDEPAMSWLLQYFMYLLHVNDSLCAKTNSKRQIWRRALRISAAVFSSLAQSRRWCPQQPLQRWRAWKKRKRPPSCDWCRLLQSLYIRNIIRIWTLGVDI